MEAALRKQLKSINKYNKIERNNYNLKTELGHLLRMVHTWICITTMTEHPEGRRKEDRSKTTWRKSTVQEQLQLWWNNWASARAAARGRGRWRECIEAKILFYFISSMCSNKVFCKIYIFFVQLPFVDKRKILNFVNISAEMIHLISYYNKEKFYRYIHQEVCMDFKLTFTISEWNTRCQ